MNSETDRRERILIEASAQFLRNGFECTTVDQIAAGAKVSKQAIYAFFRDKEDLFEQVVRGELGKGIAGNPPFDADTRTALEAFVRNLTESFGSPRNFGLFRANLVATRKFPLIAAMLHEHRRAASRSIASYIEQLVETGELRASAETPLDLATRLGGVAVEGTRHFLGYDLPNREQREAQISLSVHLFLKGFVGAPAGGLPDDNSASVLLDAMPEAMSVGGARLRLKPERFELLCDAATGEFLEHGFEGASIDRITAAAGVARSTIYRQFGSKEGLFRYVVARHIDVSVKALCVPEALDLPEKIELLAAAALDLHLEPRSVAMHHLLVEQAQRFPDLARRFYDMQVCRVGQPFRDALVAHGYPPPTSALVRAFHTLATFGVRFIAAPRAVTREERRCVASEAASIILHGQLAASKAP